jgi:Asp-tRNA(Asn)/Glu-tRNA(Gln) amidotransferase A subunit family amidase
MRKRIDAWLRALCLSPSLVLASGAEPNPCEELSEVTVAQLHHHYASHRYSVTEVTRWHLERIESLEPTYNALVEVHPLEALAAADRMDQELAQCLALRPLCGVPVVIKANTSIKGYITNNGWLGYMQQGMQLQPSMNATVVDKLVSAGAIVLGQTNMPDFAMSDTTRSTVAGRTGNAFAARYSPGGSSGGTATAVSLGFAVIGQGTDTGNSIRNPAASASLVGVLPTRGLVSIAGIHPLDWLRDNTGPLARTVTDAAIALDVMKGEDPRDPQTAGSRGLPPGLDYRSFLKRDALKGKRFGVPEFILNGYPLTAPNFTYANRSSSPQARALFMKAVEVLRAAGATVVFDGQLLPEQFGALGKTVRTERYRQQGLDNFLATYGPATFKSTPQLVAASGLPLPERFLGPKNRFTLESDAAADSEYWQPRERLVQFYRSTLATYELDGLVYPALQVAPNDESHPLPRGYPSDGPYSNSSWLNILGAPAVVVPAGFYENGLPFGVEFAGDYWADGPLLGYAYAFEQATRARRSPLECGS